MKWHFLCKLAIATNTFTMREKLFLTILLFCLSFLQLHSQEKNNIKFGKVNAADFKPTVYSVDSSADAIIIADIGYSELNGNNDGGFSLEFKNYRRARILKKSGNDVATVEIYLYTSGSNEEELKNLKAVTYNLENGKVVETKLNAKSDVFKERMNKHWVKKKFTFPNIKEGSIIEFEYKIESSFLFNLKPWEFQGRHPRLWSEYTVTLPEFYYYVTLAQGYQPFHIKDQKSRTENFTVTDSRQAGASDRSSFTAGVTDFRWVMKDVPSLKPEGFTSTINNHIAKIEFQLAELRYPFTPRNILGTWTQLSTDLLKSEDFGYSLSRDNPWLNDVMDEAIGNAKTSLEKAKNIYAYVQRTMTCTHYSGLYLRESLKNILKNKNGTEAEINLLLIAMLKKAGLNADPVMLSTRSHGYVYSLYPLLERFNYVICQFTTNETKYFLDASHSRLGFGKLPADCYNGHARVVDTWATPLELSNDTLVERKVTSVFINNQEKGGLIGSLQQVPGYFESYRLRDQVKESGIDNLFSAYKKAFNSSIEMDSHHIDSLDHLEEPLAIKYTFKMAPTDESIIYMNPMFGEGYKENPFKSSQRRYPVEMPYTLDETYLLQLQVPEGYVIDELPKQIMVKLNEQEDGMFEYRISESNGYISLRSRLRFKRAYFQPDEYEMLREFFNLIVKKHSEQIVFKKKA
jgi:hypothetical protein